MHAVIGHKLTPELPSFCSHSIHSELQCNAWTAYSFEKGEVHSTRSTNRWNLWNCQRKTFLNCQIKTWQADKTNWASKDINSKWILYTFKKWETVTQLNSSYFPIVNSFLVRWPWFFRLWVLPVRETIYLGI